MALSMSSPRFVFSAAIALRAVLLVYGLFQDAFSPLKYTDIDYFVFTDAARFIAQGKSPYARDTYRYTPLLAWLIYPTTWSGWFCYGKVLFALGDVVAGYLILLILRSTAKMPTERALKFASIWLLNPMVAQISTRGSSEGLLGVLVTALLWAVTQRRIELAGFLLGFSVHFKIYPFIYAPAIVWWLDNERLGKPSPSGDSKSASVQSKILAFFNKERIILAVYSLATFMACNVLMYYAYGFPFLQHTYLHHVTRIDHRHNFSPYNTLLYLNSSPQGSSSLRLESLAFVPQLLLSTVAIPLALAKKDLPSTLLAQTFAFVTFNKVCTSQYFLWYLVFLPFYLPESSLLRNPTKGLAAAALWVVGQALWLQQGYQLEFLGNSTFVPGLWASSIVFFLINCWILGTIVTDVGRGEQGREATEKKALQ
ncbi:glycosyltransferase family 50 protein [Aplosporella prunicola CBS 121167]|uniref:GPI mannosyltransferase 1 n=1 Tax=Aplosporella prunicola CBS 121167 TaxID=1176127 RepID=A0A6A6BD24_9PEZI|nr:glycosyltransferase family 50 protein [Aplosporella prunicola CBS 121167]KAF2141114.1 glycosyltransferase family 50 protein [Aplosporella prunicola CBS 121167]